MQKVTNKIKGTKAGKMACVVCMAAYRVIKVLGFGGVGGWLIYRSTDKVTIGVGVALGLVALAELIVTAYKAENK